ncbi:MAG: SDR family NAD(P)-dependent oxidoreductase [Rhodospirillaceae bacterium]|nr:SDR family NAD(P)-dependent oxidoreductase [Rhodospirillaceae bacterium]
MSWQSGLKDNVIIITGAGKGLGRAYALDLAAHGVAVVVNNRWRDPSQPSSAQSVVDEIKARGGKAVASHHAVEEPASGEDMVKLALDTFGRLDAVIANAGVPEAQSFGRMSLADFRGVFDVNFFGTLHLVHAAWTVFLSQKRGRVVVSTSAAGLHGNKGMAAYSSSKAALIGLMRALSVEGEGAGLRVNAIAPYAATAMTEAYITPELAAKMQPAAVAPVVSWLASPACDVSGHTFVAGAGRLRRGHTVEGPLVALGSDIPGAVRQAMQATEHQQFAHANAAFQGFLTQKPAA